MCCVSRLGAYKAAVHVNSQDGLRLSSTHFLSIPHCVRGERLCSNFPLICCWPDNRVWEGCERKPISGKVWEELTRAVMSFLLPKSHNGSIWCVSLTSCTKTSSSVSDGWKGSRPPGHSSRPSQMSTEWWAPGQPGDTNITQAGTGTRWTLSSTSR